MNSKHTFTTGELATTGMGSAGCYVGTIEDIHPQRGVLLIDRRLTMPRGAWFAPSELRPVERTGVALAAVAGRRVGVAD